MVRRKHAVLIFSKSTVDINEATVLWPHNGYTNMRKWYENGLRSAEDDRAHPNLVSVVSIIEAFIGYEKACHIEILKKELICQWSWCVLASQWLYWYDKMIWTWIVQYWRWSYRTTSIVGRISNWYFYWRGGSISYWNSHKVTQISK